MASSVYIILLTVIFHLYSNISLWIESGDIANTSSSLLLSLTGMQSSTLCGFTATVIMKENCSLQALPVQCIVNIYSPSKESSIHSSWIYSCICL